MSQPKEPWDGATDLDPGEDSAVFEDLPTMRPIGVRTYIPMRKPITAIIPVATPERRSDMMNAVTAPRTAAVMEAQPGPISEPMPAQSSQVILLDAVSRRATEPSAPSRGETAAGGIAIVAAGTDGERVRKLCHAHGLLIPVMASIAVVHESISAVVIGEPAPPAPLQIVHVVRPAISDAQIVELLRALVSGRTIAEPPPPSGPDDPKVLDGARKLATAGEPALIEAAAVATILELADADRAQCLLHDPLTDALWSPARQLAGGDDRRATAGLVGWAAHTGQAIHASPAGEDPRWVKELDDPDEGKKLSRLLVQPVIGADRVVRAVLVAGRRWRRSDFTDAHRALLARYAALIAPVLDLGLPEKRRPRVTQPGRLARALDKGE